METRRCVTCRHTVALHNSFLQQTNQSISKSGDGLLNGPVRGLGQNYSADVFADLSEESPLIGAITSEVN